MAESVAASRRDVGESSFSQGWRLFKSAIIFIFRKPAFLIPIFISWVVVGAVTFYIRYWWIYPDSNGLFFLELFGFILLMTYVIFVANLMLLELIKQLEDDQQVSFGKALAATISSDSIKVIPLAIFFAIAWFIIVIIQALTRKSRRNRAEPSLRDAAQTLAGIPGGLSVNPFSWLRLGLRMFEKMLRMTIFLALPAIAWEHEGSFSAFKKAVSIVKKYPLQFLSEYGLTLVAGTIMAIPLIIIFLLDSLGQSTGGTLPNIIWYWVIFYEGVIWTLGIYLEQMSMALLYLWQMKYESNGNTPDLSTFNKPDLLENLRALKSSQI
ncbi:MAG TPA: hypothetical protein VMU07_03310 [Candidatus Paceibacterota bacterium]|nr:hypothetical protein [Candidatus Paceibacterota bacterium]